MTKADQRKAILAEIDRLWHQANNNIAGMSEQKEHPQVRDMITKNAGFKLALEDVNQFIHNMR